MEAVDLGKSANHKPLSNSLTWNVDLAKLTSYNLAHLQLHVGWSFHVGAFRALRRGRANMDVLISSGSWASYTYSLISVFHRYRKYREGVKADTKDYFETAALLITFLSLGKLLESIAKGKTSEVRRSTEKHISHLRLSI